MPVLFSDALKQTETTEASLHVTPVNTNGTLSPAAANIDVSLMLLLATSWIKHGENADH